MVTADGAQGPQHDHLTLGEVNDGGGVVNDAEAQGNERVDGAIGQAGNKILEKGTQSFQGSGQWSARMAKIFCP